MRPTRALGRWGPQRQPRRSTHAGEDVPASWVSGRSCWSSQSHIDRCEAVLEPPSQAGATTSAYGIHRRDHGCLVAPSGVPQTPQASPIWGSGVTKEVERGGWKREADQAPGGGDGVSAGPGLCRWSSRALVVTGGPTPPTNEYLSSSTRSLLGTWSSSSLYRKPTQHYGPLTWTRTNNHGSSSQL